MPRSRAAPIPSPIRRVAVSEASAYALGFNWYLSQNIKWMFDYEHTDFEGGSALGDLTDEEVIFGRVQLGF